LINIKYLYVIWTYRYYHNIEKISNRRLLSADVQKHILHDTAVFFIYVFLCRILQFLLIGPILYIGSLNCKRSRRNGQSMLPTTSLNKKNKRRTFWALLFYFESINLNKKSQNYYDLRHEYNSIQINIQFMNTYFFLCIS